MLSNVLFSSARDDWGTPHDFFIRLDSEFHFTLDPCADDKNHKCDKWFSKEQNGLSQDWSGEIVFCNPPYGRQIYDWVHKAFSEVSVGTCKCVVMLLPARTDTAWFHDLIYQKAEVRFLRGRLKFEGAKFNAPFPCMIVVFHPIP